LGNGFEYQKANIFYKIFKVSCGGVQKPDGNKVQNAALPGRQRGKVCFENLGGW